MVNVVNIGSSSTVVGGTITITIGAGGVPALAHIFLTVCDNGNGALAQGSATDTAVNNYSSATGFNGSGPYTDIFRERTGKALVNGNTIVYTLSSGGTIGVVDAFYVTGLLGAPATANATAQGTSTSPSVTSGTPNVGGLFFVGVAGGLTAISSFTQDSTNAAWASPPGQVSLLAPPLGGGNVVNSTATALTYNPTFGTSDAWTAVIAAFRVDPQPGWEVQPPFAVHPRSERSAALMRGDDGNYAPLINFVPFGGHVQSVQPPTLPPKLRGGGIKNRSEFGIFPDLLKMGWEVQPPQPPHPVPERRAAATMRGDDGTADIRRLWVNRGDEVAPFQPPHPRPETRAAAIMRGDDGVEAKEIVWLNAGYEVQPVQPPHPRPERSAAVLRGDDGTQARFINWLNAGAEVAYTHIPHPRPERSASLMRGDDGTHAQQTQWFFVGYEIQPVQPPHPRPERAGSIARGDDGSYATFTQFFQFGWPVQLPQPPHPRSERSGAVQFGETGTEAVFVPQVITAWGYEPTLQPPHPRIERSGAIQPILNIEALLTQFFQFGWPVQPIQPPHPRPERSGAVQFGDTGTQAVFVPPATTVWGYELTLQPPHPRFERAGSIRSRSEFGIFPDLIPMGWGVQDFQPPHPRSERSGAVQLGDQGTQAAFVPPVTITWGFEFQWQPFYRLQRGAAIEGRSEFAIPSPPVVGWEVAYTQLRQPKAGGSALQAGDGGVYGAIQQWFNAGWDVLAPNPPHPRPERGAALARGDDGTQNTLTQFFQFGWPVQFVQPPHPRPERVGAILIGESGIEAQFVPPSAAPTWGWDVLSMQPPHPIPERRASALMRGDDGIEFPFATWYLFGWPVQTVQPPHPRSEARSASIMRGDDGTQSIFSQWYNAGWEVQPPPPPHPRSERAGAIQAGEGGIAAPFVPPIVYVSGWDFLVNPYVAHPRPERIAAFLRGDDGIVFPLQPPPPIIIVPTPAGTNTYIEWRWTVANLPPPTLPGLMRAFVTDSTVGIAAGIGNPPMGGGTHVVPVYVDENFQWVIG